MLQINCPFCGLREQTEFGYHGEAHIVRPVAPDAVNDQEWGAYLFFRANPKGLHHERWSHDFGCRRWFNITRDTVTGEIHRVYLPESPPPNDDKLPSSPSPNSDEMSDDKIRDLLGSIGKECFVRFFPLFKQVADGELPNKSAVEIMGDKTDYTKKARDTRVSDSKKIIEAGKAERALEMIAESSSPQISDETRARAREIIAELESQK